MQELGVDVSRKRQPIFVLNTTFGNFFFKTKPYNRDGKTIAAEFPVDFVDLAEVREMVVADHRTGSSLRIWNFEKKIRVFKSRKF